MSRQMMVPRTETPHPLNERARTKGEYARFFWPGLHAVFLVVAFCAFPSSLAGILYGANLRTALALGVFFLASYASSWLARMYMLETPPATPRQFGYAGWLLFVYCVVTGLGWNWACMFLWFSRRYAFFSIQVIGATCLVMAFFVAIALLAALLTRGNWRKALTVFLLVELVPAAAVMRLGLLR